MEGEEVGVGRIERDEAKNIDRNVRMHELWARFQCAAFRVALLYKKRKATFTGTAP